MSKSYGFQPPVIDEQKDWFFKGANTQLQGEPLVPDGQWTKYLPPAESQIARGLRDTNACTNFGTLHALSILFNRLFGNSKDWSERFAAIVSSTDPRYGNNCQLAIEAVRKRGLIDQQFLPFPSDMTVEEFYSPIPMTPELLAEGQKFLKSYRIGHEYVGPEHNSLKTDLMIEALKYSPLGISVAAWHQDGEGMYYFPEWAAVNHWTCIYGYEYGKYWLVFDSDDTTRTFKKIRWDSKFAYVKRYSIEKILTNQEIAQQLSLIQIAINKIKELVSIFLKKPVEKPITPPDEDIPPPITPVKVTIKQLGKEIMEFENVEDESLNNPFALRYSKFQAGQRMQKGTGKMLAYFSNLETGIMAGEYQLKIVCNGTSPAYNAQARILGLANCSLLTLNQFISIYAPKYDSNDPRNYTNKVAADLGISPNYLMKDFL